MIKSASSTENSSDIMRKVITLWEGIKEDLEQLKKQKSEIVIEAFGDKIKAQNELGLQLFSLDLPQNKFKAIELFMPTSNAYTLEYAKYASVIKNRHIHDNLKLLVKMAGFITENNTHFFRVTHSLLALSICTYLKLKMNEAIAAKDGVKIFDCAHQLLFWREHINILTEGLNIVDNYSFGHHVGTTVKSIQDFYLVKAYIGLIKYYNQLGKTNEIIRLLDNIQHIDIIHVDLLEALAQPFLNKTLQNKKELRLLASKIKAYVDNHKIPFTPYEKEFCATILFAIDDILKENCPQILEQIESTLKGLPTLHLTTKYHESKDCLQVRFPINLPKAPIESLFRNFKPQLVQYRPEKKDLLIYRVWELNIKELIPALVRINGLFEKKSPAQSALKDDCADQLQKLSLSACRATDTRLDTLIHESAAMNRRNTPKKGKHKEEVAVTKMVKNEVIPAPLPVPLQIRAHSLGFHLNEPDFPVYPLSSGKHIPIGIFYTYGLKLENSERAVTQEDKVEYQKILEEGQIVAPGRRGLRIVRSKESGMENQLLFKITHPRRDLRILLLPDETFRDENGQERHLYRAGVPKFHK